MNIKKWCLGLLVMLACAGPALADGLSSTLNATTSIAAIAVVSGDGQVLRHPVGGLGAGGGADDEQRGEGDGLAVHGRFSWVKVISWLAGWASAMTL